MQHELFGERTWTVGCNDGIKVLGFDAVDDIVTASGDEMAGLHDGNELLLIASAFANTGVLYTGADGRTLSLNFSTNESYLSGRSHA